MQTSERLSYGISTVKIGKPLIHYLYLIFKGQRGDIDEITFYRRQWSNPELVLFQCGVRLEHLEKTKVDLILELLEQSLSEDGFNKVRGAMKANKFLGEICARQAILNEHSYS